MRAPSLSLIVLALVGCATQPTPPPEPLITVQLRGTAVEVQQFIEDRFRKQVPQVYRVESATDRAITFKADCMSIEGMNPFKCAAVMMAVGNSGWAGPFGVLTFRTAEIRGDVSLSLSSEWCATNAFGRTNCMPNGSNANVNAYLRRIEADYQRDAGTGN